MDHLKEGIGLRGYGQKDPLIEYKKESFDLFQDMMDRIEDETIRYLFFLQVTTGGPGESGNGGGPGGLPERPKPVLPFSDEDEEDDEDEDEEALVTASSEERRAAQSTVENFTRNIQRKKDKEMAELQFVGGGDATAEKKQAVTSQKGRPQRSLPLRQRQEIQEMPRSLILAVVFVSSACAAIWPDRLGDYQRKSASDISADAHGQSAAEFGLEAIENADYGSFQVTASRFKDTTGAYAAALDSPAGFRVGNYLVTCQGKCPKDLPQLVDASLPQVSHTSVPTLDTYLPSKNLLPRSERYILGPVGLKANAPDIPASAVNFDFGTEGEIARYRTPTGTVMLAVFSFPLPSMARQQLPEFQKITGAAAKRTGPLVAVVVGPAGSAAASEKLLSEINYQGVVAENERPPVKPLELKPETAGQMILSIISLAALLLLFCLLSGLAVGGMLRVARRFGYSGAEGSLITLHLEGK